MRSWSALHGLDDESAQYFASNRTNSAASSESPIATAPTEFFRLYCESSKVGTAPPRGISSNAQSGLRPLQRRLS